LFLKWFSTQDYVFWGHFVYDVLPDKGRLFPVAREQAYITPAILTASC